MDSHHIRHGMEIYGDETMLHGNLLILSGRTNDAVHGPIYNGEYWLGMECLSDSFMLPWILYISYI